MVVSGMIVRSPYRSSIRKILRRRRCASRRSIAASEDTILRRVTRIGTPVGRDGRLLVPGFQVRDPTPIAAEPRRRSTVRRRRRSASSARDRGTTDGSFPAASIRATPWLARPPPRPNLSKKWAPSLAPSSAAGCRLPAGHCAAPAAQLRVPGLGFAAGRGGRYANDEGGETGKSPTRPICPARPAGPSTPRPMRHDRGCCRLPARRCDDACAEPGDLPGASRPRWQPCASAAASTLIMVALTSLRPISFRTLRQVHPIAAEAGIERRPDSR